MHASQKQIITIIGTLEHNKVTFLPKQNTFCYHLERNIYRKIAQILNYLN